MFPRRIPIARAGLAVLSLVGSSGICLVLLIVRAFGLREHGFGFIPWNLLLAWIPAIAAMVLYTLYERRSKQKLLAVICALVWFLFYPNAPYLITDLVHLQKYAPVPRLYDILLMMSLAWTGLFLGNLSLYLMQEIVRSKSGWLASWIFVVAMMAFGSIGVLLGRFLRWNSWDALINLGGMATKAAEHLHELTPAQAAGFSATFFAFSLLTYTTFYTFAHLHSSFALPPSVEKPSSSEPVRPDSEAGKAETEKSPPDPVREKAVAMRHGLS